MGLGNDEARGEQRDATCERVAKQSVRLGMVLVALAAERDPGAAIDEQADRTPEATANAYVAALGPASWADSIAAALRGALQNIGGRLS